MFHRALIFSCLLPLFLAAQDVTPFPSPADKKGLQVQMVDDALTLGVHHAALNVALGGLFSLEKNPDSIRHVYEGREYWINPAYVITFDTQIKQLTVAGVVVYAILLSYPTKDAAKDKLLLHPRALADGKYIISAFNTATEDGLHLYKAMIDFLAERYSGAHPEHGRIWGYIIGNEVNSQWVWYNMGKAPMQDVVSEYEKAVRAAHDVVRVHSKEARVYLSFDHHWNAGSPGVSDQESYRGRDFLDAFARFARERGDFAWHVAYHPYPDDLGNPRTWLDKDAWPNDDAPHVTFKNLEVLCRHLGKSELLWEGRPRRVILSEQGIHCLGALEGPALQAAGFAYAWEKVARLPGIDALIWHRHVDHSHEGGLRLGLWANKPGSIADPGEQRPIYDLFKKAGTPGWEATAQTMLPVVGLKSWEELAK